MKQIAQNYKSGELAVLDVPAPACRPGGVLVQSLFSLISTGTEMMKVTEAKMSMIGKARARPDQVRKVLDTVAQQGAVETYKKVMTRLDSYTPLGYSLCGVGLVGQLVVRLLIAAGVRVIGIDVIEERCRLAEQAGAVRCAPPTDEGMAVLVSALDELSSGRGADHVFLAAGGSSNAPVETA